MSGTNNSVFLDSSILIEYVKGTKTALLEKLFQREKKLFINSIVLSEFLFHFLALRSATSPLTLKRQKKISPVLKTLNPVKFIQQFNMLSDGGSDSGMVVKYE